MPRFIALTETPLNRRVLINVDAIVYVTKGQKDDTYIKVNTGVEKSDGVGTRNFYFFVKEPVDQIEKMLLTDNTRPPIMMTADDYRAYQEQQDRSAA